MEEPFIPQEAFKTPEEEIAYLRERIQQREKALSPEEREENTHERVLPVIQDYAELPQEKVLPKERHMSSEDVEGIVLNLEPEEHDARMGELLSLLSEKGVKNTLTIVRKMDNPHIEDDFHRFLVQYIKSGYEVEGLKKGSKLKRALTMTLFEIVLPRVKEESREKTLEVLVSSMEQLYAGLLDTSGSKNKMHIAFEFAVEQVGEEVGFYMSVPTEWSELFEKQVRSIFPDAVVTERPDDYNIFNEEGVSVGAYAQNSPQAIYPIKLYDSFDHDPLSVILNAFSKLSREGEGASVQFVIHADDVGRASKFRNAIKEIEKGKSVKEAIDIAYSLSGELWQAAKEMFKSTKKKNEEEDAKKKEDAQSELAKIAIENIKEKLSSPLVGVNIRLAVSASSQERAESILDVFKQSFNQFENTHGNKVRFKNISQRKIRSFLHDMSFRIVRKEQEIPFNITELTTMAHLPVQEIKGTREVKETHDITAPAPVHLSEKGVVLGINKHRGEEREIHMAEEDRMRHLYTIGQTGTGKSVLLTNMMLQDIHNGEGCCFIDPHGTDVEYVLANIPPHRYKDVIYFDPANTERPMGLNMLEYDTRYPEQKTFVVNEMLSIFNKLFDMKTAGGPMFEQYFRNAVLLTIDDPESGNTLLDVSRVLSDTEYRALKLSRAQNPTVKQYWREVAEKAGGEASLQNIVPYITSKFDVFLSNDIMRPIIAQSRSSLDFRSIMDSRKILLVNLSKGRLGDINANLIGLIIVGKILMSALSRVDSLGKDTSPFYLYIDEFQNITTDSISVILSEARKYKLSLTIAHQFIKQLQENIRDAVFGNVGSMVSFRVSSEDAEVLEKQFAPIFSAHDIQNIPNWNAYVKMLIEGVPVKPFSLQTLPPPEGDIGQVAHLKQLSALTYGRKREDVEAEIMKRYSSHTTATDIPDTPLS